MVKNKYQSFIGRGFSDHHWMIFPNVSGSSGLVTSGKEFRTMPGVSAGIRFGLCSVSIGWEADCCLELPVKTWLSIYGLDKDLSWFIWPRLVLIVLSLEVSGEGFISALPVRTVGSISAMDWLSVGAVSIARIWRDPLDGRDNIIIQIQKQTRKLIFFINNHLIINYSDIWLRLDLDTVLIKRSRW